MAGAGGGMDCHGDYTISAFERLLLGWIECPALTTSSDNVSLTDLYAHGGCHLVNYQVGSRQRTMILSNRQRIGVFDRYRRGGTRREFELGLLRTTGLLAMITDGRRVDVLPADNTLDNYAANKPYDGDLWNPTTGDQITPWTRPNVSGYTRQPAGVPPAWFAIDNIRYADDQRTVLFDYVEDYRQRPVVRRDSWMGAETSGTNFGDIRITNESTLTVAGDIRVSGLLEVDPRARLVVAPSGRLTLSEGARIQIASGAELVVAGRVAGGALRVQTGGMVRTDGIGVVATPRDR
jgi:hypothetical protein